MLNAYVNIQLKITIEHQRNVNFVLNAINSRQAGHVLVGSDLIYIKLLSIKNGINS